MKHFVIFLLLVTLGTVFPQNTLQVLVKDAEDHQPLAGANVYFDSLRIGASTNTDGHAIIENIPNGHYILTISYIGYQTQKIPLHFPLKRKDKTLTILLQPSPIRGEQIVVTSTRNNSVVAETPVRIEVLGQGEIHEELTIQPGNISKFLSESSSIVTQRTSSISGVLSFRLQGLPPRYTQLLKDGFPDFSGLAGRWSLLQIPPLDLKQIEIIRGSYPTLFANGAIAGIVNLVTRRPTAKPHLDLLFNQTNRSQTDISAFYRAQHGPLGLTFLSSQSTQNAVDVNNDGFSDIPQFRQTTVNPRFFYKFNKSSSLMLNLTSFFENRRGGDMQALHHGIDSLHAYLESYSTRRIGMNTRFQKQFPDSSSFTLKASFQKFHQNVAFPHSFFSGEQNYLFSEATYFRLLHHQKWVWGVAFIRNAFQQANPQFNQLYNHRQNTISVFSQDDWKFAPGWIFQTGLRWDYQFSKNSFFLPHFAILFHGRENFKMRLSGGMGYITPFLNDVVQEQDFYTYHVAKNVKLHPEKSRDVAFDFTYRYWKGKLALSLNQAFYATWISHAQFIWPQQDEKSDFLSSTLLSAYGAETHLLLAADELEIFIDYNYVKARRKLSGTYQTLPFTPTHKVNLTITYEQEDEWRTGIEGFFTGKQFLPNGKQARAYLILGFMFEKRFPKFSLIFNIENLLDERQSKYENIVLPPPQNPHFQDIYMPIDGRVMNLALWVKL